MDSRELLSVIRAHRADSLGVEDGELTVERAQALDHYHGRPYGDEQEGRSQVVDRTIMETVDWAVPALLRIFTQSGSIAEFRPIGPEDEQLAQQESDYVNLVMMQDNDGVMVLHDVIKDTLILKNGYTKQLWEEREDTKEESYQGLTVEQMQLLEQTLMRQGATKVEIIGSQSRQVMIPLAGMQPQPVELWDVKLKITRKSGKALWLPVPAEEVRVSKKCRGSLQDSPFTEHVTKKTRSDLIEMGMPAKFVYDLPSVNDPENTIAQIARDTTPDESDTIRPAIGDRSMDEIRYSEAYIRVDWDGDGVAELRKVVTVADNEIPPGEEWNEPIPCVPLTGWTAKRMPHRHVGQSLDDELADLQQILTALRRSLNDNIYRVNDSELVVNTDYANLRDFMTRTPGGIKRAKGEAPLANIVMPLVTPPIADKLLPVIEHYDALKQTRSGIEGNAGVDPDVLQETTKGAFLENLHRAGQKLELMARLLAESAKDAVLQMHGLLIRHQDVARQVQLKGKWVPVNPQDWRERTDLTIKVGLGTGTEDDKRQKLMTVGQMQSSLINLLMSGAPAQVYAKAYAMFEDTSKTLGVEMPEKYAVAPNSPEYMQLTQQMQQAQQQQQQAQGGQDLTQAAQIQAQAQVQVQLARNQANAAIAQAKQQADLMIADLKRQHDRDLAMQKTQFDLWSKEQDRKLELQLENMRQMFESARQERAQQHEDARAAMTQEVVLATHNQYADLGAPGISAGVQGAKGTDTIVSVKDQPEPPQGGSEMQ